jgi:hypothetical protein
MNTRLFHVEIHLLDGRSFNTRVELTEAEAQGFIQQMVQMEIDGLVRKDSWIIDSEVSPYSAKEVAAFLAR